MSESVLNLGEKILLASRLAAIEHVRQVMLEEDERKNRLEPADDAAVDLSSCDARRELVARWRGFYARFRQEAA